MFHILHAFSDLSACELIDSERVFVVLRLCCILVSCVDDGLVVLSSTLGMLGIMSTVAQQCIHIPFQTCMWRSRGVTVLQAAVHITAEPSSHWHEADDAVVEILPVDRDRSVQRGRLPVLTLNGSM